jgi:hypothetical protein
MEMPAVTIEMRGQEPDLRAVDCQLGKVLRVAASRRYFRGTWFGSSLVPSSVTIITKNKEKEEYPAEQKTSTTPCGR